MRTCLGIVSLRCQGKGQYGDIHGIAVHGLAHKNIVVVPVGKDLLHGAGGLGLPGLLSSFGGFGTASLSKLGRGILVDLLEVS